MKLAMLINLFKFIYQNPSKKKLTYNKNLTYIGNISGKAKYNLQKLKGG